MIDWVAGLPTAGLIVVLLAGTALLTAASFYAVMHVADGPHAATVEGVSPGLLSPIGLVFGLIVGFLVAAPGAIIARSCQRLKSGICPSASAAYTRSAA